MQEQTDIKPTKVMLGFPQMSEVAGQTPTEIKDSSEKWVRWGKKNDYPKFLWEIYLNSSIHQAIIDGTTDYVCGEGINTTNDKVNREDLFRKIAFDFVLFGGFALEIVYNLIGEIAQINHIDFMKVRTDKECKKVYFKNNWEHYTSPYVDTSAKNEKAVEYDIFCPDAEKKTAQMFYYKGTRTRSVYPIPRYIGSTQAIETAIEIQNYHINAIRNNFCPSAIINFNNGQPTDDEKSAIEQAFIQKFTGSSNASNFVLSFNDSKDSAVTIERLASDDADEKFEQLQKDTKENIFIGHRVTSGALFGLVQESTGFNAIEFENSFHLYNKTVIQPIQKELTHELNDLFGEVFDIVPYSIPQFNDGSNATPKPN